MKNRMTRGLMAISLPLVLVAGATGTRKATESTPAHPGPRYAEMMQQTSPEGQKALRDCTQSERRLQAMASMMDMARRMRYDAMFGTTQVMEMMTSPGGSGLMGGEGGMTPPRGTRPGK